MIHGTFLSSCPLLLIAHSKKDWLSVLTTLILPCELGACPTSLAVKWISVLSLFKKTYFPCIAPPPWLMPASGSLNSPWYCKNSQVVCAFSNGTDPPLPRSVHVSSLSHTLRNAYTTTLRWGNRHLVPAWHMLRLRAEQRQRQVHGEHA